MRDKDADLRAELRAHLDMAIADRVARGEAPRDAEAAARRELGNLSQIQEAARDVWGRRWLANAAQDTRYALRVFRRNPGFAAVALLSLALGIGANTALFQVVDAVRLQTLPVADPSTLVDVHLTSTQGARGRISAWHAPLTSPIWEAINARQQALAPVFAWGGDQFNLASGGEVRMADGLWVSGDFFSALGIRAAAGRVLTADDDRPGCAPRAVLSYAFWQRQFGGSLAAIGTPLSLGSHPVEIVGVAPREFFGMEVGRSFDVAIPLCADPVFSNDGKGRLGSGTDWWLHVFGRLKPGWTVEKATAHLAAISPDLFRATLAPNYPPVSVPKYLKFTLAAYPAASGLSQLREEYEAPLWMLLATAGLVLLIACANLANLLLARATARQREIAVRLGLGASRGRVVRQLLTESLLLAAIGGAAGSLLAGVLSRAFVGLLDTSSNVTSLSLRADWRVIAFTAGLALLTCLLFGLAPALSATRISANAVMRATSRGTTSGREAAGIRRALVVVQVSLSVVLLFGSLLFARSLRNVLSIDPGFRSAGIIAAGVNFRQLGLEADQWPVEQRAILERVRALPGVDAAATVDVVPVSGYSSSNDVWPAGTPSQRFNTLRNAVGPGYFAAMGIRTLAGRDFNDGDTRQSALVAIVNETFAASLGRGPAAVVGSRFVREAAPGGPDKTYQVVGVVRNSKYVDLKEADHPVAFVPGDQEPGGAFIRMVVRSALPAATITTAITRALADINPRMSVTYTVLSEQIDETVVRDRILATLSGWFGGLAAILTLVGLYGLIAYTVTRRTNEIGVRLALGAGRGAIARLILREIGALVAIGAAAGTALAFAAGHSASALVYGVRPSDPLALAGAVAALATIALLASYAPARRATRIEPVIALRQE